ncbi:hypothetical protein [Nostoc sp. DedSLP04]|nr:hypothetical protein [Nostoc sp. DedSLP04]
MGRYTQLSFSLSVLLVPSLFAKAVFKCYVCSRNPHLLAIAYICDDP